MWILKRFESLIRREKPHIDTVHLPFYHFTSWLFTDCGSFVPAGSHVGCVRNDRGNHQASVVQMKVCMSTASTGQTFGPNPFMRAQPSLCFHQDRGPVETLSFPTETLCLWACKVTASVSVHTVSGALSNGKCYALKSLPIFSVGLCHIISICVTTCISCDISYFVILWTLPLCLMSLCDLILFSFVSLYNLSFPLVLGCFISFLFLLFHYTLWFFCFIGVMLELCLYLVILGGVLSFCATLLSSLVVWFNFPVLFHFLSCLIILFCAVSFHFCVTWFHLINCYHVLSFDIVLCHLWVVSVKVPLLIVVVNISCYSKYKWYDK